MLLYLPSEPSEIGLKGASCDSVSLGRGEVDSTDPSKPERFYSQAAPKSSKVALLLCSKPLYVRRAIRPMRRLTAVAKLGKIVMRAIGSHLSYVDSETNL